MNNPKKTSLVGDKIVFITGKVSNCAALEKKGIDWDDLQYARAIYVDPKFKDWEKWDIFNVAKGLTPKRVKGLAPVDIAKYKSKINGKKVTVDYKNGAIYETELKVEQTRPVMRTFDWVEVAPEVPEIEAILESANCVY